RLPSFTARVSAGSPTVTPSTRLLCGPRSRRFDASHASAWRPRSMRSPAKTCGWRRIIFSQIRRATSANANAPASSAMRAWNTTWNSRSPSSSSSPRTSPRSIASATSYASSIVYGAIVSNVCSRSHGQPRSRSRSVAMISRRRRIPSSSSGFRSVGVIADDVLEGFEHRGRRAPDPITAVLELPNAETRAETLADRRAERAGRENPVERNLENGLDLGGIRPGPERRRHEADDRRDGEPRAGHMRWEPPCDSDDPGIETHLLPRLAQRGGDDVRIARIDAPAGKADLSGMMHEVARALREQHRPPGRA